MSVGSFPASVWVASSIRQSFRAFGRAVSSVMGVFSQNAAEIRISGKHIPLAQTASLNKSASFQIGNMSSPHLGSKRNNRSFGGFVFNCELVASEMENWSSPHLRRLKTIPRGAFWIFGHGFSYLLFSQFCGFQPWGILTLFSNETAVVSSVRQSFQALGRRFKR